VKNTPFHVRLDDDQAEAVTKLAARFRVKEIDVIRWAIDALIAYVEKHDGHLHLPVDFNALWEKIVLTAPEGTKAGLTTIAGKKKKHSTSERRPA